MKKFIIVGPTTALMYLNVFALIKEGKLYTGVTHPQNFDNGDSTVKEMNCTTIQWYENVARVKFNAPQLTKKYNAEEYPKFDNIEAINIDRVKNIPYDYDGIMGVPITFLSWYYPQYEIIGLENHTGKCSPMVNGKAKFARVIIRKKMKKFIIVGNMNAVDYKEIFPLIRDNQMWLGASKGIGWKSLFLVPDNYEGNNVVVIDGKKYAQNNTAAWFTNVEHKKRNTPIDLCKRYSNDYKHYDNYDAIEVGKISDIPMDYDGVMGVPLTFFFVYCPKQFEIIGNGYTENIKGVRPYVNGKRLYSRIFIRKRNA